MTFPSSFILVYKWAVVKVMQIIWGCSEFVNTIFIELSAIKYIINAGGYVCEKVKRYFGPTDFWVLYLYPNM